jgi:hypothetical protein
MGSDPMPGDAWDADVTLDTVSITGTRDGLPDASPKVTESPSSSEVGKAHYMAKGDRLATLETDRMVRDTPLYLTRVGVVQLESGLRSKDSRAVRWGTSEQGSEYSDPSSSVYPTASPVRRGEWGNRPVTI